MNDQKVITIENVRQYKFSDLLLHSLDDIELMNKNGIPLYMENWFARRQFSVAENGAVVKCCVCYAGAVMAGMNPTAMECVLSNQPAIAFEITYGSSFGWRELAELLDKVRRGMKSTVAHLAKNFYNYDAKDERRIAAAVTTWEAYTFYHMLDAERIELLKASVKNLIKQLQAYDL